MRNQRTPTWLIVMLAGIGLLLMIPALWVFASLTARPLHPDPAKVPTVAIRRHRRSQRALRRRHVRSFLRT